MILHYVNFFLGGFSGPISTILYKMNISANVVTVVRGFFIIYACYCFWTGEYIFFLQGSIILALNILFDFVDGDLARLHHNESEIGE